jgi:hypothetical protein
LSSAWCRQFKYGKVFKTSIDGYKTAWIFDPEAVEALLAAEGTLVVSNWWVSVEGVHPMFPGEASSTVSIQGCVQGC